MTEAAPQFIQPPDLTSMSDEEIDLILAGIRARRMESKAVYDETVAIRDAARKIGLEEKIEKRMDKLMKAIETVDKHVRKMEDAANEIRNWRLEIKSKAV